MERGVAFINRNRHYQSLVAWLVLGERRGKMLKAAEDVRNLPP